MNSANLQPPAYLILWETAPFTAKQDFLSSDSLDTLRDVILGISTNDDSNALLSAIDSDKNMITEETDQTGVSKSSLQQDLYLSSSDSDPFAGDDDLIDPDYKVSSSDDHTEEGNEPEKMTRY